MARTWRKTNDGDRALRIGVFGLGWIAQKAHLPYLAATPRVQLALLHDRDPAVLNRVAIEYGVPVATTTEEFVTAALDVVVVCTPPSNHAPAVLAALHAGSHVICEKPLATAPAAAQEIASLARERDLAVFCCLTNRYRADVTTLRHALAKRRIGAVHQVDASWIRRSGVPTTAGAIEQGVLWDLGSHLVDLVFWLTGWDSPALSSVLPHSRPPHSVPGSSGWYRPSGSPGGAVLGDLEPVGAELHIDFPGGRAARVVVSWDGDVPDDRTTVVVTGERGVLRLDTVFGLSPARDRVPEPAIVCTTTGGRPQVVLAAQDRDRTEYRTQFDVFFDGLRRGKRFHRELMVALRTTRVLAAADDYLTASKRPVGSQPEQERQ